MNIFDAMKMARAAGETLKALQDIDHAIDKAELKSKLADVIGSLADVRSALADARDEIAAKEVEIARLKATFTISADLIEIRQFKYRRSTDDPSRSVGYPICPRCEQVDGRAIFMVASPKPGMIVVCPQCKHEYHGGGMQAPF